MGGLFLPFLFGKQIRGNSCRPSVPHPPPPRPLQTPLINLKQTYWGVCAPVCSPKLSKGREASAPRGFSGGARRLRAAAGPRGPALAVPPPPSGGARCEAPLAWSESPERPDQVLPGSPGLRPSCAVFLGLGAAKTLSRDCVRSWMVTRSQQGAARSYRLISVEQGSSRCLYFAVIIGNM